MTTNGTDRRSKISDKLRKELGVCSHERVSYKSLEKLNQLLYKRIKSDQKQFKILAQDILLKNQHIKDLKKMNEMMIDKYEDKFEEFEKANEDLKKANTQLMLNVEDLKGRLFGHYERRLKDFALRPNRKKDN